MEELIGELITVDDISSKLSDLSNRFDDFLRRFEADSSDLAIPRNCNRLLTERVVKLEKKCSYKCSVPSARICGGKPCPSMNQ